jgi:hypothetical protein
VPAITKAYGALGDVASNNPKGPTILAAANPRTQAVASNAPIRFPPDRFMPISRGVVSFNRRPPDDRHYIQKRHTGAAKLRVIPRIRGHESARVAGRPGVRGFGSTEIGSPSSCFEPSTTELLHWPEQTRELVAHGLADREFLAIDDRQPEAPRRHGVGVCRPVLMESDLDAADPRSTAQFVDRDLRRMFVAQAVGSKQHDRIPVAPVGVGE